MCLRERERESFGGSGRRRRELAWCVECVNEYESVGLGEFGARGIKSMADGRRPCGGGGGGGARRVCVC